MSGVNGVHSLLAFLIQQLQPSRHLQDGNSDLDPLETLLKESRRLNETLLKIEKSLPGMDTTGSQLSKSATEFTTAPEGQWPAASMVRDAINRQEQRQAFGSWPDDKHGSSDDEPFSHRVVHDPFDQLQSDQRQILLQKYEPTEDDIVIANISSHLAPIGKRLGRAPDLTGDNVNDGDVVKGKLLLIGFGMVMILFSLLFYI